MKHLAILAWAVSSAFLPCLAGGVLRTAGEINRYIDGEPAAPANFAITATVTYITTYSVQPPLQTFYCESPSGAIRILNIENPMPKPGDVVSVSGQLSFDEVGNAATYSNLTLSVIGHVEPPRPEAVPLSKLDTHLHHNRYIETEGTVVDVIPDDISRSIAFLLIADGGVKYPVSIYKERDFSALRYLDARVRVRGLFMRRVLAYRTYSGPYIESDKDAKIAIVTPPPADPFAAPPVQHYPILTPQEIDALPRSSETGYVLTTWNGDKFIMRTPKNKVLVVTMLDGISPPRKGDAVKVVGYPTTDLFRINLSRAITRHEPSLGPFKAEPPESISPESLTIGGDRPSPDATRFYHGRTIRYRGIVKDANSETAKSTVRLQLQTGTATTTVNAGASGLDLGKIPVGSEVEVTGICVFEGENWTSERIMPHLNGFMLVLRTADDLVVVRNPPWWTIGRLTTAVALLLVGLLLVVLWNRNLNRLVNRRGHELARERVRKEYAQLKTGERTRLAVELHDSLSQNLEGVACQVAATRTMLGESPGSAKSCLDTAERMLDSCRLELKRCLFDLRGNALEEKDLSAAIRKTLAPICEGINLEISFDIRRSRFDDSIVHAMLCMIRELVSNAIRHGNATQVGVSGEYDGTTLTFTVSDNGCGFDPADCAGPAQGHFGLAGVRERAERLDGTVEVESETGKGTKVNVMLKVKS